KAVEETVEALAEAETGLFQRGGQLVRVVRPSKARQRDRIRPSGGPRIELLPAAVLRIALTRAARFLAWKQTRKGQFLERVHPAGWLVDGVHALGEWPGLRHLEAVTECPVLRPDGSVLDVAGYDPATGILYQPCGNFPLFPQSPSREDARQAAAA